MVNFNYSIPLSKMFLQFKLLLKVIIQCLYIFFIYKYLYYQLNEPKTMCILFCQLIVFWNQKDQFELTVVQNWSEWFGAHSYYHGSKNLGKVNFLGSIFRGLLNVHCLQKMILAGKNHACEGCLCGCYLWTARSV